MTAPLTLTLVLALAGVGSTIVPSELELDVRPATVTPPVPPRAFTAAVAESVFADGFPEVDLLTEPDAPWRRNMDLVRQHVDSAAKQDADLLVLAEYGIFKIWPRKLLAEYAAELPSVDDLVVTCNDPAQHEVVANLSCMAREHRMYIVANYIEKEPCSPDSGPACPKDAFSLFNTNLVFDRNGALIQTYRKYNLFGVELEHLQSPEPHLAAFRTDFGAVIGLMTCFDILFELPAVEMARRGVTHFAFPTNWGDELPSLTALQMHSAWPRGLGVTLLSAGLHQLNYGSIGSGIFTGSGSLGNIYDYSSGGDAGGLVTATVPAAGAADCGAAADSCPSKRAPKPRPPADGDDPDAYYPVQHYNVSEFVSVPLTTESVQLCDGEFCCQLTYSEKRSGNAPVAGGPTYRLLALDGRRNFAPHWSTRVCAVVLCADDSQASCSTFPKGALPPLPPAFSLRGTYEADWTVFPSVILTHMELTDRWRYNRSTTELEVTDPDRLLVAQLYGRNYALDEP